MPNGGPTPAQIQQVQQNLANMQAFNDYVYNQGQSKVLNAYLLLSEQDNTDLGNTILLNILEGSFWAIGSNLGPAGNFAASFLSGMIVWWATNPPPSLNTTFASLLTRMQATCLAIDKQLAQYYQDVPGNWQTQFVYNGKTTTLADCAAVNFPAETNPEFEALAAAALFALDQQIWKTVLVTNFVITKFPLTWTRHIVPGEESVPPVTWNKAALASNPAYYYTWTWHKSTGCTDEGGWSTIEYNIGTGTSAFTDGSMSRDACKYLFIDSADSVVINAQGLFPRATVFTKLGIRKETFHSATGDRRDGDSSPATLSKTYLRAMKTGQTLGKLIQREGRESVQQRVIAKAQEDSVFAYNLAKRPRQTLESFLEVKIPDVVSINVIVETPLDFGIVVPHRQPTG
jgi:hypothetical protein